MKSDLIAQIDQQIATHEAELQKLRTARQALAGLSSPAAVKATTAAPRAKAPTKRAPPGYLEDAMEKAIKAKPGLTNGDVRKALTKAGYAYSLTPLHVGKRLSAMVEEKRLSIKLDGNLRRYHPAK